MQSYLIHPDIDPLILECLPLYSFINMRLVGRHFNNLICNDPRLKRTFQVDDYQIPYISDLTHISTLQFEITIKYDNNTGNKLSACNNIVAINLLTDQSDSFYNNVLPHFTNISKLRIHHNKNIPFVNYISLFTNLTHLELPCKASFTDRQLSSLTNIIHLDMSGYHLVTDESIKLLTNIKNLHLNGNPNISHDSLTNLKMLQKISLGYSNHATVGPCIRNMTNITSLNYCDDALNIDQLNMFTNITRLCFWNNSMVNGIGISALTNITDLDLSLNNIITDDDIMHFTNIQYLSLEEDKCITNEGLKVLTNITYLSLERNSHHFECIGKQLTNIVTLILNQNSQVTDDHISSLTSMQTLVSQSNHTITNQSIQNLVNLTKLTINRNDHITDASIKGLTNLIELQASNCDITVASIKYLSKLKYLNMDVDTDEVKEYLPKLRFISKPPIFGVY